MARRHAVKIFCRRYYSKKITGRYGSNTPSYVYAEDVIPTDTEESQVKNNKENPPSPQAQTPAKKRPKHVIAIHSGFHGPDMEKHIKAALDAGYKALESKGKSMEAVEVACRVMENNTVFNCGKGSALTNVGTIEMEASVMDGESLRSGSISGLYNIEHPVTLARMVMDKTPHITIVGQGSNLFAQSLGFPRIPPQSLVTEEAKTAHSKHIEEYPGVAAVIALDPDGNLATAMSSGGMRGKLPGRVGTSALVGSGFYADNNIAAVTTTDNPAIVSSSLAFDIIHTIGKGMHPLEAAQKMLLKLQLRLYKKAGAVLVTKNGDVVIALTKEKMDWAFRRGDEYKFGSTEGYYPYNG